MDFGRGVLARAAQRRRRAACALPHPPPLHCPSLSNPVQYCAVLHTVRHGTRYDTVRHHSTVIYILYCAVVGATEVA